MSTLSNEIQPASTVMLRDCRWKTRWLVIALSGRLLWRCSSFMVRPWLGQSPAWLQMVVMTLVPQVVLLLFPLVTRSPHGPRLAIPTPTRGLIELGIAVPFVVITGLLVAAADYAVGRIWPGQSLTPEAVRGMARSPDSASVYLVLVLSVTVAPVAEELFFRGFLYNALRARMSAVVAAMVQSLVFGFSHTFGATHAVAASVIGLVLTGLYAWRKTLLTPVLAHAGINLAFVVGVLLAMSAFAARPVLGVMGDRHEPRCVVRQIAAGSPAEQAGLRIGDVIIALNKTPVRDFPHLVETIALHRPGDAVPITVDRSGQVFEITVELRRRDAW